jgi:hypothetical protein
MPSPTSHLSRHSPVRSIRISESGFTYSLRIERAKPQQLAEFLRENELEGRFELAAGEGLDAPPVIELAVA